MTAQDASFDWLDAQEEWERYSAPLSKPERARLQMQMPADALGAIIKSQIGIEGMHCANCSLIVESKLKSLPGVLDVQVHANSKKAHILLRNICAKMK